MPAPSQAKKPRTIHVVVVTTASDLDEEFHLSQPLQVVFERALTLVGGHPNADQFTLEFDNEPLTDLHRKLEEYAEELGWGSEVEFELVPAPEVI